MTVPPESKAAAFVTHIDMLHRAGVGAGKPCFGAQPVLAFALCFGFEHMQEDD